MGDRGFPTLSALSTVELRLLGRVSTRVQPGREAAALLAQPKRVALLGYLAAATPRGFHRRDTLLALFWPEADQEHARGSLRKSVHFLRQQLGPETIVSRGDEEIGLDIDRCWCDVVAFEEAVGTGQWERAAELYQGDLLPGLHLSDVPEFERWLEETRTRLRSQAVRVAWQLSDQESEQSRTQGAVQWARRAIELSPYDEDGMRRLLGLLIEAGDRPGALLTYEQFAQRLSTDLELEPSAETVALIESVRNHKEAPFQQTPAPSAPSVSQTAPASQPDLQRAGPRRPRSAQISVLMLGIALAIGAFVWWFRSPSLPKAPPSPDAVAILPFAYQGNREFGYLAEGMVDLLTMKLDGAPGLRTVDQRALLGFVNRQRVGNDLASARRAAEHFGADRFVLGNIVEAGGRLVVSATVYDAKRGSQASIDAAEARPAEIFQVADQLARHILSEVQDRPLELAREADQGTSSLAALKAYIEGEQAFRNDQYFNAVDAFQRAVRLDSAFALAHYRLGFLTRDLSECRRHFELAQHHSRRLGEHQRGLIDAMVAAVRGDHKQAEWLYRQVLAAHPDDVEAWSILGGLISFTGPLDGYAWVDGREAWERTLKLDPHNAAAVANLAAVAARDRRLAELDSLTERYVQLHALPYFDGNLEGQRAVVRGDSAGLERFIADLRSRPDLPAQLGAGVVTWNTGDLVAGRRLWRLITEPNRSTGMRVLARVTLAKLELTSGRWMAAQAELDSAGRLDPGTALEQRGYYALTYFLNLPQAYLLQLRNTLERWDASAGTRGDGLPPIHRSAHRYGQLYLLGMLNARLGDDVAALRYASELEKVDTSSSEGAFAFDQAKVVRAEIARTHGQTEQALARLEQAGFWTAHSGLDVTGDWPFTGHFHERFARAELLYQLGRRDEALRWYRSLSYDLLYTAPSHYRLAQIYQARGDQRSAGEHYRQFVETWRNSDPMLRSQLQQAELELARSR